MMMVRYKLLPALALLLLSWACTYDKETIEPVPDEPVSCDSIAPTYVSDIEPIINQNCAVSGCHVPTNGNGIPYSSYEDVKAKVDNGKLRKRVIEEESMPPSGSLTDEQLRIIECWLDAGAPKE